MKKTGFLLLTIVLLMAMALPSFGSEGKNLLVIDVRTEAEWNDGHLEGAILIPYDIIGEKIETVARDKATRIYVYCRTGRRSGIAKQTLETLGYKDVVNLGSMEEAAGKLKRKIRK